jgi:hypothetical protein
MSERKLTEERGIQWPYHLWEMIVNIEELIPKEKENVPIKADFSRIFKAYPPKTEVSALMGYLIEQSPVY